MRTLTKLTYSFKEGDNRAELEIMPVKKEYEIFRICIKQESFINEIIEFAEKELQKFNTKTI